MTYPIEHRQIEANGIRLHIALQGEGPLVVLCHGFPGLWYGWRHQMRALAEAGYRAVALDQRGYGRSDRPLAVESYDSDHAVGDLLGVLDALGESRAVFVGHDFGAPQVWNLAVRHPERVRGVAALSCPYDFDLAGRGGAGSHPPADAVYPRGFALPHRAPSECFAAIAKQHFIHLHYFQAIGPAERELGPRVREFLTRLYWALSARGQLADWSRYPSEGTGYLDVLAPAPPLPWPWMSEADMSVLVAEYERAGPGLAFIGGLNSYRVADRNWALGARHADARVERPAVFISGARDPVLQMVGDTALEIMRERVPDLRGLHLIDDAGHFVQVEQPEATNRALLAFLESL